VIRNGNHTDLTYSNSLDISNVYALNPDFMYLLFILSFELGSEPVISFIQ